MFRGHCFPPIILHNISQTYSVQPPTYHEVAFISSYGVPLDRGAHDSLAISKEFSLRRFGKQMIRKRRRFWQLIFQATCSVDVHCESLTQPDEIFSRSSSITKAADPFIQPKKNVPTSNLTLFICRAGCKHYDSVTDATDGIFKEFCCYGRSYLIKESRPCDHFEDKNPVCDGDGILRF